MGGQVKGVFKCGQRSSKRSGLVRGGKWSRLWVGLVRGVVNLEQ